MPGPIYFRISSRINAFHDELVLQLFSMCYNPHMPILDLTILVKASEGDQDGAPAKSDDCVGELCLSRESNGDIRC